MDGGGRLVNTTGTGSASTNYAVPAYVRNLTTHPDRINAAAKVGALSSGGMGDFEIPAFLRKQAD
jgi:cell division protein FtsZ